MAIYRGSEKIAVVNCAGFPIARAYNGSTLVFTASANQGNQEE